MKRFNVGVVAVVSLVMYSGCGGGGDSASTTPQPDVGDDDVSHDTAADIRQEDTAADSDAANNEPALYESPIVYDVAEVTRTRLMPAHRRGPNPLPDSQLSVLPLTIKTPDGAEGPLPIVIWSHGGGSRVTPGESGPNWTSAIAARGYAVIAMHHMARSQEDFFANVCDELGVARPDCDQMTYTQYYESTDRPKDAVAVLDALELIADEFDLDLDTNRIAIAGHSGGTNSPLYLAGGRRNALFTSPPLERFFELPDPRPSAFIAMSPPGGTLGGYTADSLAAITRPVLSATGAGDIEPTRRIELHDSLAANERYRAFFNDPQASHSFFNLTVGAGERQPAFREILVSIAAAFLDTYLRDLPQARAWLESNEAGRLIDELVPEQGIAPSWDVQQ